MLPLSSAEHFSTLAWLLASICLLAEVPFLSVVVCLSMSFYQNKQGCIKHCVGVLYAGLIMGTSAASMATFVR